MGLLYTVCGLLAFYLFWQDKYLYNCIYKNTYLYMHIQYIYIHILYSNSWYRLKGLWCKKVWDSCKYTIYIRYVLYIYIFLLLFSVSIVKWVIKLPPSKLLCICMLNNFLIIILSNGLYFFYLQFRNPGLLWTDDSFVRLMPG